MKRHKTVLSIAICMCMIFSFVLTPTSLVQSQEAVEEVELTSNAVLSDGDIVNLKVPVVEDESILNSLPDTNFDGTDGLAVGKGMSGQLTRSYLKFNLSHIPDGAAFIQVTLHVYLDSAFGSDDEPISVYYSSDDSWTEQTITWNNAPSYNALATDTIDSPASPDMFVPLNWYSWDITSDVVATLSGNKILTSVLVQDNEVSSSSGIGKTFMEDEANHFNASYISIEYTTPQITDLTIDGESSGPYTEYVQDSTPLFEWVFTDPDTTPTSDTQRAYEIEMWSNEFYNETLLWGEKQTSTEVVFDQGDATNGHPFGVSDEVRLQMKFPASIIPHSGTVDKLYFNASIASGTLILENLEVFMLNTASGDLTTDFAANYLGRNPVQVLNRDTYEVDIQDHILCIDIENTFFCSNDSDLIIEFRLTNSTSDLTNIWRKGTGGPGSAAGIEGLGASVATTATYAQTRTYELDLEFASEEVLSESINLNSYPFGTDLGESGRFQFKYNKSLIGSVGYIDKLAFRVWGNTPLEFENFSVQIGETSILGPLDYLDFEGNYGSFSPATVLNESHYWLENVGGYLIIDIEDSFYYSGDYDLIIDIQWDDHLSGIISSRETDHNAGGYRAWDVVWLSSHAVGDSDMTYDLYVDFIKPDTAIVYSGPSLVNSTRYYPRVRACDRLGVWTSWASMDFKYEPYPDGPAWHSLVEQVDPLELGEEITVNVTVTYPLGVNTVDIEFDGSNHSMTRYGDEYSYSWIPTESGTLNYIIFMEGWHGIWNSIADSILVQDTISPDVSSPSNIDYIVGSTGHELSWNATDFEPDTYEVFKDGVSIISGAWNSSTESVSVSVDGLVVGVYNYTIVFTDISGNSASDEVVVTVSEVSTSTPTTPTTPTTGPIDIADYLIYILIILALVAIIVVLVIVRRKKK